MQRNLVWITVILLICAALRFHGLVWTLPYLNDGDEWRVVNNGLSVYFTGHQSYETEMHNYPPLRSWEVASIRAGFVLFFGEMSISTQALVSRLMSLFYALLTTAFLYRIGSRLGGKPSAGLVAAGFFATWPEVIKYGQLVLADGPSLMFFVITIWASLEAYRRLSYRMLNAAILAGVFAIIAKYNAGTVLLLPGLAFLYLFWKRSKTETILLGLLPALMILLPMAVILLNTVDSDDLRYSYFDPSEQLRHYENRASSQVGLTSEDQFIYQDTAHSIRERLARNADYFFSFLPIVVTGLAVVASVWRITRRETASIALMVLAGLSFVLISLFQASGARQLFGSMIVAVILAASIVPLSFQKVALALVTVALSIQGYSAWTQNDGHYITDVRVATAEWFIQNAEDGSRIAMESVPLELMRLHGYEDEKQFEAVTTRSIYTFPPELWQCMAFDYLVADAGYASYGGYYSGDGLPPNYRDSFEPVAQFHQPDFVGGQRTIFRIMPADLTCDSEAVAAALTELQVEPGPTVYHPVGYFPAFAENDILQGLQQGYGAFAARIVGEDQQPIADLTLEIRSDAGRFVGETFPVENDALQFLQENVTIGHVPEGIYILIVHQGTTNVYQQVITIESRKTAFFHIQLRSPD